MRDCKIIGICLLLFIFIPIISFSQNHQDWSYNQIIYEVNVRQYTEAGTFAAFENHLAGLHELGVGILWFMPIHPIGEQNRLGGLGSYYSVKDYLAVNPEFGTMDEFKALVDKAHEMGMYVIIDWVANHTAWDNVLTITNPDWYSKDVNGNFIPPPGTDWTDVIDLDYNRQGLRDYMINAMKYWIQEAHVDGFRCDAVSMMPLDFWKTAIAELKSVKSDLFMLAEGDGQQYQNVGFDMTYAWGYHGFGDGILNRIANGSGDVNELSSYITSEQTRYSHAHYRMYFTSNHDENSWYGTVFEQFGDAAEVFAVLTCMMNGMPLIYSGEEAGLDKRLLFFDKDQIEWQQHPFAEIYTTLFHLKKENHALWNGDLGGELQRLPTTEDGKIIAFIREKDEDNIFVILNLSSLTINFTVLDTLFYGRYSDAFTSDTVAFNCELNLVLPGWAYKVYIKSGGITKVRNENRIEKFMLSQNYPNPFNQTTKIQFYTPAASKIKIVIYNSLGEKVKTLIPDYSSTGFHTISWDSKNEAGEIVSSGMYYYKIIAGNRTTVRKMLLLR